MSRMLGVVIVLALATAGRPAAHQLDEYLQAARISLERDRMFLEIDLTPGVAVADDIVAALDRDRDGIVVPLEARAYGEAVVRDLEVKFDGRPVPLTLGAIEVPPVADMRRGVGTMQLTAVGMLDDVAVGKRRLRFSNHHRPAMSVYLANALVPRDRAVKVVAQVRDTRQQRLDIEYDVSRVWPLQLRWVLVGATILSTIAVAHSGFSSRRQH